MAGWIKELLLDYGLNRLSIDQRSDISTAISSLIAANVLKPRDIIILHDYIAGYTATEIAEQFVTFTDDIETTLQRVFRAIETASGYTDTAFMRKVRVRYAHTRLVDLSEFLIKHGQRYHNHEIAKQ